MEYQQEEAQEVSELKSNSESDEKVIVCKVETIHDGSKCKHEFVQDYTDSEGKIHLQCAKCMAGVWKQ